MTTTFTQSDTAETNNLEAGYQRAQTLLQGVWNRNIAFNTTLIPHWIADSQHFWYEREFREGREFRLVDAEARSNELAFDHHALAQALAESAGQEVDAKDLPISKIEMTVSPRTLQFFAFGKWWRFDAQANRCTEVERLPDQWLVSPNGKSAAFIRDDNLWIKDLASGDEKALTNDGHSFYSYASIPSAWGQKINLTGRPEALWSSDSKRLLTLQMDRREVEPFPVIKHLPADDSVRPQSIDPKRRVAFPGDRHVDEYRVVSIDAGTGRLQAANFRPCPVFRNANGFVSVGNAWWSDDNRHAYFIDLERGDRVARLVAFDTQTGATRIVIEEESPTTCFKLHLDSHSPTLIRPLADSNEVLWYSERSGWAHLYVYDLQTGELKRQLTSGDWLVRDVLHYNSARRELLIQTAGRVEGRNPYLRDICRINIDSGELTPLAASDDEYIVFDPRSEMAGNLSMCRDLWGAGGISHNADYMVTTRTQVNAAPVSVLLDRNGEQLMELETADVSGLPEGWQWPEPVKTLAADGKTDIYGTIFRPSDFSPDKSYPVLDISWNHEEGCHYLAGAFTNTSLGGYFYLRAAAFAELGFIVVYIFGRGTSSRHRAFSDNMTPWLPASVNQQDRIAGIKQLAQQYPYMDLNRIGAGGSFMSTTVAASGLLGNPEFYKVGVSDCAVLDYRINPAFFGEAYAGETPTPEQKGQIHEFAHQLKGKLLLMHGMMDTSCPIAGTLRLIEALRAANKDFDMLVLPNDGHSMSSYAIRRSWDYLCQHLLGVTPPREFHLTTSIDKMLEEMYAKRLKASR